MSDQLAADPAGTEKAKEQQAYLARLAFRSIQTRPEIPPGRPVPGPDDPIRSQKGPPNLLEAELPDGGRLLIVEADRGLTYVPDMDTVTAELRTIRQRLDQLSLLAVQLLERGMGGAKE